MKLYYAPGACSLSPHIVALELGLPLDLVQVDIRQGKLADGSDFSAINSKGYVPVLEFDDGRRLTEGPAIVQYLADRKPEAGLAPPAGSLERYRLQEWLNFITSEIHKQFSPLFNPALPDDWKQAAHDALARRFDWLSTQLTGKSYLMGENFTVADAYLFTVLNWSPSTGIDLAHWPVLQDYVARMAARPKVREALQAEGLLQ
ncbi:MAG: glutathione transferase GstA [Candidatus Competibacteraceae bacterium]